MAYNIFFHTHKLTPSWLERTGKINDSTRILWKDLKCEDENYYCIGDDTIHKEFRLYQVPNRNWHWINCDAGILTFLKRNKQLMTQKYLWFFEWDVAWSNSLLDILNSYENDNSDLLCPHLSTKNGWFHANRRNKTQFKKIGYCENSVVRISRRLLDIVLYEISKYAMFCEMRLPCTCLNYNWCKMRDLTYQRKHIGNPFQWPHKTNSTVVKSYTNSMLFHRVKS